MISIIFMQDKHTNEDVSKVTNQTADTSSFFILAYIIHGVNGS